MLTMSLHKMISYLTCEGDALILCRLLGFAVNSFDRPPQLGAVGPVVYQDLLDFYKTWRQ